MKDYKKIAEMLFPNITNTPQDYINKYPKRNLKEGRKSHGKEADRTGGTNGKAGYQKVVLDGHFGGLCGFYRGRGVGIQRIQHFFRQ